MPEQKYAVAEKNPVLVAAGPGIVVFVFVFFVVVPSPSSSSSSSLVFVVVFIVVVIFIVVVFIVVIVFVVIFFVVDAAVGIVIAVLEPHLDRAESTAVLDGFALGAYGSAAPRRRWRGQRQVVAAVVDDRVVRHEQDHPVDELDLARERIDRRATTASNRISSSTMPRRSSRASARPRRQFFPRRSGEHRRPGPTILR